MKISQSLLRMQPSATRAVAERAKDLRDQGVPVLSLSSGVPGFKSPEASRRYAERAMEEGKTFYTVTTGNVELRNAVSDYYKDRFGLIYENDQIIVGAGAKPLIFEALGAIIDPGDEVILTAPAWVSYVEQIRFFGGKPVIVETKDRTFEIDLDRLRASISEKTVAIVINSPNNPTGVIYSGKIMENLC
ncbi:MAG: aminotransferase class I/II-fold pyridoxal phosphate-dependent enzyme, partial [Deltaproteobacteria bacterium]|nr:aminotransferase class I/II-fold pyridoxal phosphate-dependent enzyme [Deltaproteobacteria bacterium]